MDQNEVRLNDNLGIYKLHLISGYEISPINDSINLTRFRLIYAGRCHYPHLCDLILQPQGIQTHTGTKSTHLYHVCPIREATRMFTLFAHGIILSPHWKASNRFEM